MNSIVLIDKNNMKINMKIYDPIYKEYNNIIKEFDNFAYFENGIQYVGYIKELVKSVFDKDSIENQPYKGRKNIDTSYDFILKKNQRKYKVKALFSCINYLQNDFCWSFYTNYNKKCDAFLLIAFDSRENSEPQFLWFLKKGTRFRDKYNNMSSLWNRQFFLVFDYTILEKFQLRDELEKLKEIMKNEIYNRKRYCDPIQSLLLDKQREILENTGNKLELGFIAERAIELSESRYECDDEILMRMKRRRLDGLEDGDGLDDNEAYQIILKKLKLGDANIKDIIEESILIGIEYFKI